MAEGETPVPPYVIFVVEQHEGAGVSPHDGSDEPLDAYPVAFHPDPVADRHVADVEGFDTYFYLSYLPDAAYAKCLGCFPVFVLLIQELCFMAIFKTVFSEDREDDVLEERPAALVPVA